MDIQLERRSGKDRRHRFLNGLDRRQTAGPTRIQQSAEAFNPQMVGEPDPSRSTGLWQNYGFAPPVE